MAIRWSYKKREEFAESKNRTCAHCGATSLVSKSESKGNDLITYIIDHIQPQINGGSDEEDNLQLLCRPCNASKNALDAEIFLEHHALKAEVERMKTELAEISGLEDTYIKRMLHSFSVKDQFHVLKTLI